MSLLPIFLKLDGRSGLLVGAGTVALDKIDTLLRTGIRLRVIAPRADEAIRHLAAEGKLEWIERSFEPADLDGNFIVIAATDIPEVNAAVYQAALRSRHSLQLRRRHSQLRFLLRFGRQPRRSANRHLHRRREPRLRATPAPRNRRAASRRPRSLARRTRRSCAAKSSPHIPRSEERKLLLHELAHRQICDSPACSTRQLARTRRDEQRGKVFLVGAGPGDPDLLTVKALRLIQSADVILHDDLVPRPILDLASPSAEMVNVGKRCGTKSITQEEIHELMIDHARAERSVVRLKSGDPLIFGRAAEEMAALTAAEIPFEVVPGITAAFAAAAAAGVSLTSRNSASNVVFSTGHHAASHNSATVPERESATRVVYMPGRDLLLLALEWLEEGLPPEFPCAIVSRAGQPDQQIRCTTLAALGDAELVPAPSLLIAGWAVRDSVAMQKPMSDGVSITV